MQADGKIGPEDLGLLFLTDDVEEAVAHIVKAGAEEVEVFSARHTAREASG
jgi:hypothetical protein